MSSVFIVTAAEKKVKKVVNRMLKDGHISKELRDYLIPKHPVHGKLRENPKIHKADNPYRTIVNGIGTVTERLAEVAEKELNDYVIATPSYIKDTTDFLNKLEEIELPVTKGTILFCFDVIKLYPSVPRKEGKEACREALEARANQGIPSEAVMDMICTVLENNILQFNKREYVQTEGVAIGSKLGRNFACSYMRKWDEKLTENDKAPLFYKRYIDDGFGLWEHGLEALLRFREHANSIHPNIKVELRWSDKSIEFLDVLVKLENGKLVTDLYTKPTDKHMYVDYKSDHPKNVKKAIPYGLGVRVKRICSSETDYRHHRNKLKYQLRKRGYGGKFIEGQLSRVDKLDRKTILKNERKKAEKLQRVPIVLTYTKCLPNVHHIVRTHMNMLYKSRRMEEIFAQAPIVAYRRDRNLGDLLVHGKTNKVLNKLLKSDNQNRCIETCVVCNLLERGIQNVDQDIAKKMERTQQCRSWNVVYGINCSRCMKIVYVGETGRTVKERLKEHEADVRLGRQKPIADHFNGVGHSIDNMGVVVLEHIKDNSRYYRQIRELNWIETLNTEIPNGINVKARLGVLWREYK